MRQWAGSMFSSDHVYNWSDCIAGRYIFQPICLDLISTSIRATNSRSDRASSRRGGKPKESDSGGSAQSVHSRATLKLPRFNSRRISVSTPATRRFLSTSKRWPCSGWKGWRISAHPKGELGSSAVRADRPDRIGSDRADGGEIETGVGGGPAVPSGFLRVSTGEVGVGRSGAGTAAMLAL